MPACHYTVIRLSLIVDATLDTRYAVIASSATPCLLLPEMRRYTLIFDDVALRAAGIKKASLRNAQHR